MGSRKSQRSQAFEAMQRNRRMARTLGCLVASMTTGAALLNWAQPARAPLPTTPTELMSVVRPGGAGDAAASWTAIQLDPQHPGEDTPAPAHFVIQRDGRLVPTEYWRAQRSVGVEGIVRIGLQAEPDSNEVTAAQWSQVRELIGLLQRTCAIPNQQIHYDTLIPPAEPSVAPTRARPSKVSRSVPQ